MCQVTGSTRRADSRPHGVGIYTAAMRLNRFCLLLAGVAALALAARGQAQSPWQMEQPGTTADLRGIDAVNGSIAWASGTGGTVLRTTDGGAQWEKCAVPDGAKDGATLDFRGIQGFGAETAVAMASGPGTKSRLYKTTDGCRTWELLFANPDAPQGFFDSFWFNGIDGMVLGDPVGGRFAVYFTHNSGRSWKRDKHKGLTVEGRQLAAFAASNRCIPRGNRLFARGFATGGKDGPVYFSRPVYPFEQIKGVLAHVGRKEPPWKLYRMGLASGTPSAGAFAVAYRYPMTTGICEKCGFGENAIFMAVGGDDRKPNDTAGTAAWSADGGETWNAAVKPPHGYRSAVEWSKALQVWVAVGKNGSDISRDDGQKWEPLGDGDWNALSLPFAVGPKGRIGRLTLASPQPGTGVVSRSAPKGTQSR